MDTLRFHRPLYIDMVEPVSIRVQRKRHTSVNPSDIGPKELLGIQLKVVKHVHSGHDVSGVPLIGGERGGEETQKREKIASVS